MQKFKDPDWKIYIVSRGIKDEINNYLKNATLNNDDNKQQKLDAVKQLGGLIDDIYGATEESTPFKYENIEQDLPIKIPNQDSKQIWANKKVYFLNKIMEKHKVEENIYFIDDTLLNITTAKESFENSYHCDKSNELCKNIKTGDGQKPGSRCLVNILKHIWRKIRKEENNEIDYSVSILFNNTNEATTPEKSFSQIHKQRTLKRLRQICNKNKIKNSCDTVIDCIWDDEIKKCCPEEESEYGKCKASNDSED